MIIGDSADVRSADLPGTTPGRSMFALFACSLFLHRVEVVEACESLLTGLLQEPDEMSDIMLDVPREISHSRLSNIIRQNERTMYCILPFPLQFTTHNLSDVSVSH
jgi:hypothetical protein